MIEKIKQKIYKNQDLTKEDLTYLLDMEDFSFVYDYADKVCKKNFGNVVTIRAIVEFSNHCGRLCKYCGLNAKNKNIYRYRMGMDEVIETSIEAYNAGYKTVVLQSGEDKKITAKDIGDMVKKIKSQTNLKVTVSSGEMSYEEYAYIKACGADRYLLKHETSDEKIYSYLHGDYSLERRLRCLYNLKKLGYETGSGFMIGLPSQTTTTIAKDLLILKGIPCDMAGIGPFIPHPDTPLKEQPAGSTKLTKRAVALARILLPKANLPATTALGVLDKGEKDNIFSCGANVIMRKVTPQKYEKNYNIYPSNITVKDIRQQRLELEKEILDLGKIPV